MSQEFRREYLLRLPLPLAQLYSRAYNAKDARGRHDNAFYLCEALVKLAAAPLIAAYLEETEQGAPRVAALDRLLAALALPSLGQWLAMLRELARWFGARPDAAAHPLGQVWGRLNGSRTETDLPGLTALYRRIKNGVDGAAAGDKSCSPLQLFDALVQYRNGVFGHGGPRFPSFYEKEMGPLLFPAVNDLLAEGTLDVLGPRGGRLVHLTELRTLEDGHIEVGLRELTGLQGERLSPLALSAEQASALAPGRAAVLWPGRAGPLRLDPLLAYRENELSEEVLFLNRDRNSKQVEYLSYTTGRTERDKTTAPALAALLSRVVGRVVGEDELRALQEQSAAETPSVESLFGAAAPAAQTVGDYEILGELGRGGMGVVYLARQMSLGRMVALKMLPADLAGDEVALARFRREVRALARCDHPHIVKVLASGALPDGRLYYAMEYVPGCDLEQVWRELSGPAAKGGASDLGGATLARAVRSASQKARDQAVSRAGRPAVPGSEPITAPPLPPLPPLPEPPPLPDDAGGYARRVAALVRDAALALQAVHDQGLVHRDVKPSNLMLTADGSRLVLMDFGLAKGQSLTLSASRSGGLLGTLRYAAPEQLAAANMKVGPAADVRGLGVTLWELLTRRRLFAEAEDEGALTALVLAGDVPRLRRVDPTLDRDLEAIVARATERGAADRIPTAGRLAEYLQLYLDGKPLPIRPPGAAERTVRWVRRQPALAAFMALFVLSLLAGTGVSTYFAVESHANYLEAAKKEKDVSDEKDQLEVALAKSLLRPIGHEEQPSKILDPEIEALWELAGSSDHVRLLFVEQALQRPLTTGQLRNRADMAVHAAVGLDPGRRRRVEDLLLTRLRDKDCDFDVRTSCALIGMASDDWSPEFAATASRQLVQAKGKTVTDQDLSDLAAALAALAPRLPPALAAREASEAARLIVQKLTRKVEFSRLTDLGPAVALLAPMLPPAEAEAAARRVTQEMGETNDPYLVKNLAAALAALAPRLPPALAAQEASDAARSVVIAMAKAPDIPSLHNLLVELTALAPRLPPEVAEDDARQAVHMMGENGNPYLLENLAAALAALAPGLPPADAEKEISDAARRVVKAMGEVNDISTRCHLTMALTVLAPRLPPADAEDTAQLIVKTMANNDNPYLLEDLSATLAALAPRLPPALAAREASEAARLVVQKMTEKVEFNSLIALGPAVASLAPMLPPAEAEAAARRVAQAMGETDNYFFLSLLARPLAALAPRLRPGDDVQKISDPARRVVKAMGETNDISDLCYLAAALRSLAPRLQGMEASDAARRIVLTMAKTDVSIAVRELAAALATVAARMPPADATNEALDAVRLIVKAMGVSIDASELHALNDSMAALIIKVEPVDTSQRICSVVSAVGHAHNQTALVSGVVPLADASRPLPGRFTDQQLVDLLKMPLCRHGARQVIVTQLGNQCGRPFANMWDFVDWAREHRPDLDLSSPPVRPAGP